MTLKSKIVEESQITVSLWPVRTFKLLNGNKKQTPKLNGASRSKQRSNQCDAKVADVNRTTTLQ